MLGRSKRQAASAIYQKALAPAIGGGVAFWAATVATSFLPIAAEYRAALANPNIQTVWVASLPVGMLIGYGVSYSLLRFFEKIPTQSPILKAVLLSVIALFLSIIVVEVPQSLLKTSDAWRYLLIGVMLNIPRFLLLGAAIGYLCNARAHSLFKGDTK